MGIPFTMGTSLIMRRIDPAGNETLNNGQVVTDNAWNVNQFSRYQAISDDSGDILVVWVSVKGNENRKETVNGYELKSLMITVTHNGMKEE